MTIISIRLQNFRSYRDAAFELDEGVNIIVGPNASGKTNLLEAVLFQAVGKSYRARTEEVVMLHKPWARIEAISKNSTRVVKITNDGNTSKTFEIDKLVFKRLPATKKLSVVLFEPEHLLILSGKPDLRRDYLDNLLEQTNASYGKIRRDYKRTLAQRNALLKNESAANHQQLFAWNVRLSELGGSVAAARRQLVSDINRDFAEVYKALSAGKVKATLSYESPLAENNYESSLLQHLENNLKLDLRRGFTSFGPHREDFSVSLNSNPVQEVASRGEIRTLLLTLKVLEITLLEKATGQKPLILLDDVFSELDGSRRQALTRYLKDHQTFITTTDADVVAHNFAQRCNIISLG